MIVWRNQKSRKPPWCLDNKRDNSDNWHNWNSWNNSDNSENWNNWRHPRTIVVIQIPLSLSLWGEFVILNSFQINIYTILDKTRYTRLLIPWSRPQVVRTTHFNAIEVDSDQESSTPRVTWSPLLFTPSQTRRQPSQEWSCSRNVTNLKEEQQEKSEET